MNKIVATILLLVFLPAIATCALVVWLTSSGPAIYRQPRVGQNGRLFTILKIRTMTATGRVTLAGRWLRACSVDELPQLWNVIKGDMRLVGPRPERPHLVAALSWIPGYPERVRVKPGMTGWAQVHGLRGATSITERVRLDLYYIERASAWLDLRILLMTTVEMLRLRG